MIVGAPMKKPTPPNPAMFGISTEQLATMPDLSWDALAEVFAKYCVYILIVAVGLYLLASLDRLTNSESIVGGIILTVMGLPVVFAFVLLGSLFVFPIVMFVLTPLCRILWPNYERAYQYHRAISEYRDAAKAFEAWQLQMQERFWQSLDGVSFERAVGRLYRKDGYKVEFTPISSDGGVDLILKRNGEKIVVQCKAYTARVGVGTARELVAARADFGADRAILIAASGVTKPAAQYCAQRSISVLDATDMVAMHRRLNG